MPVDLNTSGIYMIRNRRDEMRYIGSASNLANRFCKHRMSLERGIHHNRWLQRAWHKHGSDAFEFVPVLLCGREDLLAWEQIALDGTPRSQLYNHDFVAGSRLGSRASEETRAKLRASHLGKRNGPMSEETKRKIGNGNRGKVRSEEFRAWLSESQKGKPKGPCPDSVREKLRAARAGKPPPASAIRKAIETKRLKSRLSDNDVQEIRRRHACGERQAVLAREYRVSQSYMSRLARGERRSETIPW